MLQLSSLIYKTSVLRRSLHHSSAQFSALVFLNSTIFVAITRQPGSFEMQRTWSAKASLH